MLTSIPSPPQSVWMLGPIPIRAYALFILAGILIAWYMGDKRYQRRGGPENVSEDIGIWMVLAGIVGARIYHVITSPTAYFGDHGDWTKIFRIWEGGLGIWGAVLFGALAAWLMLRRYNLRFGAFADAFIPGVMLAQAIGRMGNYFNQELLVHQRTCHGRWKSTMLTCQPDSLLERPSILPSSMRCCGVSLGSCSCCGQNVSFHCTAGKCWRSTLLCTRWGACGLNICGLMMPL